MLNKVILIGNVGKPPEIRTFQNGNKVANFSLATTESWKDKSTGEWVNKTEWHNVSVFGGTVNFVEKYVEKGSKLYIEGSIKTEKFEQNGEDKYITKVIVSGFNSKVVLLDTVGKTERVAGKAPIDLDDEVPW